MKWDWDKEPWEKRQDFVGKGQEGYPPGGFEVAYRTVVPENIPEYSQLLLYFRIV